MTGKGIGFVGSEFGDAIENTVYGAWYSTRWEIIMIRWNR
jgi:hypothetical protein